MEHDPTSHETVEEKAKRYWRNNQIIANSKEEQIQPTNQPPINNYLWQLHKFKSDIQQMIIQRPTEILLKYLIDIQSRKNKLLREKLKRMERSNDDEL
jgi:hypothetical protein